MIKAFFFDFDGVLTTDPSGSFSTSKYLSEKYQIDQDLIRSAYHEEFFGRDKIKGLINESGWSRACEKIGSDIPYQELKYAMGHPPRNEKMIALLKSLKKNYKVGLITDNPTERAVLLYQTFNFEDLFDSLVISAEVGSMKNEQPIFEAALDSLNMLPNQCVFVDNKEKNLIIPKQMGFQTYFHDQEKNDVDSFVEFLKSLQVKI